MTALTHALRDRPVPPRLIHHSDRGVQYCCGDYIRLLQYDIRPSMSRKGNPYDKAYASYCTSCEPCTLFSGKRRRLASLTP